MLLCVHCALCSAHDADQFRLDEVSINAEFLFHVKTRDCTAVDHFYSHRGNATRGA